MQLPKSPLTVPSRPLQAAGDSAVADGPCDQVYQLALKAAQAELALLRSPDPILTPSPSAEDSFVEDSASFFKPTLLPSPTGAVSQPNSPPSAALIDSPLPSIVERNSAPTTEDPHALEFPPLTLIKTKKRGAKNRASSSVTSPPRTRSAAGSKPPLSPNG
ncbi:hypothetical protein HPP92_013651 [Vanilla planifolia]|uniref:Uncharacterized protein n=1 Tax=Vanilla planifolia TaxID=51239 RepID=A0A835QNU3_VANPL|nr:hypothetical protein HPP92_013651 [Vanilla planifolia]